MGSGVPNTRRPSILWKHGWPHLSLCSLKGDQIVCNAFSSPVAVRGCGIPRKRKCRTGGSIALKLGEWLGGVFAGTETRNRKSPQH